MADDATGPQPTVEVHDSDLEELHSENPDGYQHQHQPNTPHPPSRAGPWFSFDKQPPSKWHEVIDEMRAWIDVQMTRQGASIQTVLHELVSRFTGTPRELYQSIREYRQIQFLQTANAPQALGLIHQNFIGDFSIYGKRIRQEYFDMKCCSLKLRDIEKHYQRMSSRYYTLNGFNDPNLRYVYISSLPTELQPEVNRLILQ